MTKEKARVFSAEEKTRIVLEVLKEESPLSVIASKYEINSKTISNWKKQFISNAALAFEPAKLVSKYQEQINMLKEQNDELAKTLGKTIVERDWAVGKLQSLDLSNRKELVDSKLAMLPKTRQYELLKINRSSMYYKAKPFSGYNLNILNKIDEIYTDNPEFGYRYIHRQLLEDGLFIGKDRVLKYMNTVHVPNANEVWSGDITYVRTNSGFMYMAAIIDWHSRAVLSYKLSNSMDVSLVTEVLHDALNKYPAPQIFNSDQGSQYTSHEHIEILQEHNIKVSMNGKGRSIDNIIMERFFRTLKYNCIFINDFKDVKELKRGIDDYINHYNYRIFHSSIGYKKPMNAYLNSMQNYEQIAA